MSEEITYRKLALKKLEKKMKGAPYREAISCSLGKSHWWLLENSMTDERKAALKIFRKPKNKKLSGLKRPYLGFVADILRQSKATFQTQRFTFPGGKRGLCIPLVSERGLLGYFLILQIKKDLTAEIVSLLSNFVTSLLREVLKEMQLEELYKTVYPRACALATIHTIQRAISSTLNLDDLLNRIARLGLQLLHARRCSIMLLDKDQRKLICKADMSSGKRTPVKRERKMGLGEGIEGRVVKNCTCIFRPNILSMPMLDGEEAIGAITIKGKRNGRKFDTLEREILTTLSEQATIAIKNTRLYEKQKRLILGSIQSLATILDVKSPRSYTHTTAFADIVTKLARKMDLDEEQISILHYASILHDAGKISIPEEILSKPSKLTENEFKVIKEHPLKTLEIIKPIEALEPVMPIILHHHERYDGKGYPSGLKGEKIPLGARIMAVVDCIEAMISKRPYRDKVAMSLAMQEIKKYSGKQFDPKVVETLLELIKDKEFKKSIELLAK
jgi:HD-GYP domain-containing protein (c-di-GMP phosphodiesterase class II)